MVAKEHESLAMLGQDFFLHYRSDAGTAAKKLHSVLKALHLVPVDGRIARQDAEALCWRQLLIDGSHEREKLFEEP
jgi:hypothetical protein